jgi:hypothetical protein
VIDSIGGATWQDIQAEFDRVRSSIRGRIFTNCFVPPPNGDSLRMVSSERAVVFSQSEGGFSRLYYLTLDADSLAKLLAGLRAEESLVIGYIDRSRNESLCSAFRSGGFVQKAHYLRMTHKNFPMPKDAEAPEFARASDVESVDNLLRGAFDAMTDHLPTTARLLQLISDQQVIVRRDNAKVSSVVVFQVLGNQVNFNYIVSRGRPGEGLRIKQSFFRCMADRGLTAGFLWVGSDNERAKSMYALSGWKCDGLNDWFYVRPSA